LTQSLSEDQRKRIADRNVTGCVSTIDAGNAA